MRSVAAPTGTRGSVLFMAGGLILLGFLFMAFVFRSAVVGDIAPLSRSRVVSPRAMLPPATLAPALRPAARGPTFAEGRAIGREASGPLDASFDALRPRGVDARVLMSRAGWKRVRLYRCAACSATGCEFERGLLAGTFEALTGDVATVGETACRATGAPHCEFEIRHAAEAL